MKEYKVLSIDLWNLIGEELIKEGWEVYGYEPLPNPYIVNLVRDKK